MQNKSVQYFSSNLGTRCVSFFFVWFKLYLTIYCQAKNFVFSRYTSPVLIRVATMRTKCIWIPFNVGVSCFTLTFCSYIDSVGTLIFMTFWKHTSIYNFNRMLKVILIFILWLFTIIIWRPSLTIYTMKAMFLYWFLSKCNIG